MTKLYKMLNFIKTKYCVFCADDDFIIPNAIAKGIKFLDKNPDYIAVGGQNINFYVKKSGNDKVMFKWNRIHYKSSINISRNSPNPISRL